MTGTGRKPFRTIDVLAYGLPDERPKPPAHLGEAERRVFVDLISQCPASQFRKSDLGLLARWCELIVVAERAAAEMSVGNLLNDDDDRPSGWFSLHERATKGLALLALRLRLGPQSRADKAPKTEAASSQSYYDRMRYEQEGDGDDSGVGRS